MRAARSAMGLDPGPELPPLPGQQRAGEVSEARDVEVEGHRYGASPNPTGRNTHYYPGGTVAGRPVPARLVLRAVVAARRWSAARGASARRCCSPRCSAGCRASAYADGYADGMAAADGFDGRRLRRGQRRRRRRRGG